MSQIHETSVIESGAKIADDVIIGPFCHIGPDVEIGAGTELKSHVVIGGHTLIGENNVIYPFASLGMAPQDKKYAGEATKLVIGNGNSIREYVTMNPGTVQDKGETRIGDDNLFMALCHVAHDCIVENNAILANGATLAGHVVVEEGAIIGGLSAVHQFVRIGKHAMIGGHSAVDKDVLPYSAVSGDRARLAGLNLVGLRRKEFDRDVIRELQDAFSQIFTDTDGTSVEERAQALESNSEQIADVVAFVQNSSRGLILPAEGKIVRDE